MMAAARTALASCDQLHSSSPPRRQSLPRARYWSHWCTTKISLPLVNWLEVAMKTAKRNAWQGGAQKNPAAKEGPYKVCGDRRTMVHTADPSE
uniref:Uncharacterized protein n=1 Tax=Oryza glumipatula TaxID=40148 RepID=A0A0D9ZIM9_9ORYZ